MDALSLRARTLERGPLRARRRGRPLRELVPAGEPSEPAARVLDPLHDLLSARSARGRRGRAVGDRVRRRDEPDHRGEAGASDRAVSFLEQRARRAHRRRRSSRAARSPARRRRSGHRLAWQLAYAGGEPPLLLLPRSSYARGFPRAKAVVAVPNAVFDGWLEIDGARLAIEGWRGSQNHNWGSRHTDRYAWGQVAGFDGAPDVFLECSTARVRLGPLWTPWLTLVALRVEGPRAGAEWSLLRAARARARIDGFTWSFDTRARGRAPARAASRRPPAPSWACATPIRPGGEKICLNTKLASCELVLEETGRPPRSFRTAHRAAFEILSDEPARGFRSSPERAALGFRPAAACRSGAFPS